MTTGQIFSKTDGGDNGDDDDEDDVDDDDVDVDDDGEDGGGYFLVPGQALVQKSLTNNDDRHTFALAATIIKSFLLNDASTD